MLMQVKIAHQHSSNFRVAQLTELNVPQPE